MSDLVFLRIEVFLGCPVRGLVLQQFVGRAVDAVAGAQRGRQRHAQQEGRAAAELQKLGQDVRRVGPEIGAEEFADLGAGQLGEIFGQFVLGVAPGEVGVGLA